MKTLHLFILCLSALLAACSQYQPLSNDAPRSIELRPILNTTKATQIVVPLQRQIRLELLEAGIDLNQANSPSVEITLVNFQNQLVSRDSNDTGRPISYRLILSAEIKWLSDTTPSPWGSSEKIITVEKSVFTAPSMIEGTYQVTPAIVEELAKEIARTILQPW